MREETKSKAAVVVTVIEQNTKQIVDAQSGEAVRTVSGKRSAKPVANAAGGDVKWGNIFLPLTLLGPR